MISKCLKRILKDERDESMARTILFNFLVVVPAAAYILLADFRWYTACGYLLIVVFPRVSRYANLIHVMTHRKIFAKRFAFLEHANYWLLGILLGETPYTHETHHIGMHHPENNFKNDLSSTMNYQRDSLRSFLRYYFNFVTSGHKLGLYLLRKKRVALLKRGTIGETLAFAAIVALFVWDPAKAVVLFIVPVAFTRTCMIITNWAQHAFIDRSHPRNNISICTTLIRSTYNDSNFNDGFHAEHHSSPKLHWQDLPGEFERKRGLYVAADAIVFSELSFMKLFFLLMAKDYRTLASRFVDLRGGRSESEIIDLLKSRLAKIPLANGGGESSGISRQMNEAI